MGTGELLSLRRGGKALVRQPRTPRGLTRRIGRLRWLVFSPSVKTSSVKALQTSIPVCRERVVSVQLQEEHVACLFANQTKLLLSPFLAKSDHTLPAHRNGRL